MLHGLLRGIDVQVEPPGALGQLPGDAVDGALEIALALLQLLEGRELLEQGTKRRPLPGLEARLVENGFDETHNAILVHIKGQPARSTRRFIKRLANESKLPVAVFLDGDPWSYRIYASLAYGAIKTAHISHYLATPQAEYLGVTPSDIVNYKLPSDKLTDRDKDALKAELLDPRFGNDFWQGEIKFQLKLGKKSEQQALAKYGLDFVTQTYLPEKLTEMGYLN